jgi:cobalt/nickel transport system permease protein
LERSIVDGLSFFQEALFADESAGKKGFLQAREPRLKLLAVFALLMCVLFAQNIIVIAGLYGLCLFLALASFIDIVYFLKRTWFFIPFFSLVIAVPALFGGLKPGEPLHITEQGVLSASIFFSRVLTSVSLCVLLALTTRHFQLLRALRCFGVPQVFVMTLGMCTRYIYLFLEVIQETFIAVKSRVGRVISSRHGRRLVSWNMAGLWKRSYTLNDQVYQAMLSRGYNGESRVLDASRATLKDALCLAAAVVLLIGVLWRS